MTALLLALTGGTGAAGRFWTDELVNRALARAGVRSDLPWATVAINLLGTAVLAVLTALASTGQLSAGALLVAGTGLCGGYTTFSTAMIESVRLAQRGRGRAAVGILTLTYVVALSLCAVITGVA